MIEINSTIGEMIRKAEDDYTRGTTAISKYVNFSMYDTIEKVVAYLNSQFTTGPTDSQGREKPFFNIVVATANVWQRATDIDRRNIRIRATKSKDFIDSFLATVHLHNWMRKSFFGLFLNEWGRTLARFGSAVIKTVRNSGGLSISVVEWPKFICDPIDFDANLKIEVLELTEAQLRDNPLYDETAIDALISAQRTRQTLDGKQKDTKDEYYRLYEAHGRLALSVLKISQGKTPVEGDEKIFVDQMHVVSFVAQDDKGEDYKDFVLYSGKEDNPYTITHLIPEDGRTLGIGAVEHLFEPQWMVNHSMKAAKDQLDLATKLIFQTSDPNFAGRNVLTSMENGDILLTAENRPLTKVDNQSHDVSAVRDYAEQWKRQGVEIAGVSEAMLGETPKSGTAWRQTEAVLTESHSLFEHMTENKGLYLEQILREKVIPFIKTLMDNADEVAATLEGYDIYRVDGAYIKNLSTRLINERIKEALIEGVIPDPQEIETLRGETESEIRESLRRLGNQRFFTPSELGDRTWKEQFKDLEWELEIDITGEQSPVNEMLTTIVTLIEKVVANPAILQDPTTRMLFNRALEITGALSPIELSQTGQPAPKSVIQPSPPATGNGEGELPVTEVPNA